MMGAGKEPTTSLACYLQDCIGNVMALKSMRRNPKCLIQREDCIGYAVKAVQFVQ